MTDKEGTYKTMQGWVRESKGDAITRIPITMMCACAAFCEALGEENVGGEVCKVENDAGKVVRPQGGGGVDHPHEVQQKRAHTQILYSPSLFSSLSSPNRRQRVQNTADSCISFINSLILCGPRKNFLRRSYDNINLSTLGNSCCPIGIDMGQTVLTPGGTSYPESNMRV